MDSIRYRSISVPLGRFSDWFTVLYRNVLDWIESFRLAFRENEHVLEYLVVSRVGRIGEVRLFPNHGVVQVESNAVEVQSLFETRHGFRSVHGCVIHYPNENASFFRYPVEFFRYPLKIERISFVSPEVIVRR